MNLNARRGSNPSKHHRLSLRAILFSFILFTLTVFLLSHSFFHSPLNNEGLIEGYRRGSTRVLGLAGHTRHTDNDAYASKATIGYAITITRCPSSSTLGPQITDAAAVLKQSIHNNSIRNEESGSAYDYQLYALVHPDATSCVGPTLKSLGYKVTARSTPVQLKLIHRLLPADDNDQNHRVNEFIKLHAYTLVQHPVVVLLDLDTIILKPMDHLYDVIIDGPSIVGYDGIDVAFGDAVKTTQYDPAKGIGAFYTRDYNVAGETMKHVPVESGMMVIRPSLMAYADFSSILRVGDYRIDGGWTGLDFGSHPELSVLGQLISFYYDQVHPGIGVELNRCVYNNIADNPLDDESRCKDGYNRPDRNEECEDCRDRPMNEVSSTRYGYTTLCLWH